MCPPATLPGPALTRIQRLRLAPRLRWSIGKSMCRWTQLLGVWLVFAGIHLHASTLEKMSIEQMTEHATAVVRGRVASCASEVRGSVIYTVCRISISERWKGLAGSVVDVYIPGGFARGLVQSFPGSPRLSPGEDYVLFLWAGKSGRNQVIGLSQGAFSIQNGSKAIRGAVDARFVDASGRLTDDRGVELSLSTLRQRVSQAVGGERQ